jgi:PAS domain S-box-containing protein
MSFGGEQFDSSIFALLDTFSDPVLLIDPAGTILDANTVCAARFSKIYPGFLGANIFDLQFFSLHIPEIAEGLKEKTEEVLCTGSRLTFEEDTNGKTFSHTITPVSSPEGTITQLFIIVQENSQAKLNKFQNRFRQVLEATHAGVWEWEIASGENIWSDEIWELYGLERGKAKPSFQLWQSLVHPEDREMIVKIVDNAAKKENPIHIEYRVNNPDGTVRWLMTRGMPLCGDKGKVVNYIGTSIDITERKQIEYEREKLLKSREGFNAALEIREIGWWELDLMDNKVYRTLIHDRIFGYESLCAEWTYQTFLDHIIPEERAMVDRQFQEAIAKLGEWNIECRICRADGKVRWIWAVGGYQLDKAGTANRMSGIIQDITSRKLMEEEKETLQLQLQFSQKMQLIGQLAGGIAHDFNNMLTVILGHTEIVLEHADDTCYEDLVAIKRAATNSAELTRQLLAFAQRQTLSEKVFDLNTSVEELLIILREVIGENISIVLEPGTNDALVKLDTFQFDQILFNLCINARDAIDGKGNITIKTGKIHVTEAESAAGHTCLIPGEYVTLTITDNGHGIDKKYLLHIMEPFFSTREVGKGNGMGLATVYGIVKQSNGFIDVKSKKGKGTSVRIYLPFQDIHAAPIVGENPDAVLRHGKEIILLVEDQPDILHMCRQILEHNGFFVLSALGPNEAIRIAELYKDEIDLLVTDIIMPEMNGSQLFKELLKICPNLKALYMSGYTADFIANHLTDDGVNFIEKPFSFNTFTKAVKKTLKASQFSSLS